eukprot:1421112-Rhodomonas_salina.2
MLSNAMCRSMIQQRGTPSQGCVVPTHDATEWLKSAMLICAYGAICLRTCYAVSGTDLASAATSQLYSLRGTICPILLRLHYRTSGTDLACPTIR